MAIDQLFKHAIGKSTFEEGFSVPRSYEEWIGAPEKGQKCSITLLFEEKCILASLRRINNERGQVQVKYEGASGRKFREWLQAVFCRSTMEICGEYFELHMINAVTFRIIPFPQSVKYDNLYIIDWLFHQGSNRYLERGALSEIQTIIQSVDFNRAEGQAHYNRALSRQFSEWSWEKERRVVPELGLKSDFVKDDIWLEVEFGNARTYYQDFLKFMLASKYNSAQVGVLLVPSESFANHLCSVGRNRAEAKGKNCYSGMIHFEKVRRELLYIEFMFSMPIAIASIGFHN